MRRAALLPLLLLLPLAVVPAACAVLGRPPGQLGVWCAVAEPGNSAVLMKGCDSDQNYVCVWTGKEFRCHEWGREDFHCQLARDASGAHGTRWRLECGEGAGQFFVTPPTAAAPAEESSL